LATAVTARSFRRTASTDPTAAHNSAHFGATGY
jgi:hypothetical protein